MANDRTRRYRLFVKRYRRSLIAAILARYPEYGQGMS